MPLLRFLFFLFVVATTIHFGWEISQMSLYAFPAISVSGYPVFVHEHWVAAAKDAGMTLGIYLLVAVFVRNAGWAKKFTGRRIIFLATFAFLWALGVEHSALAAHRWEYSAAMPLLPGLKVGIVPLIQMILVSFISIFIVRKQLNEK